MSGSLNYDAFLTKVAHTGTELVYSTFIQGSKNDYGVDIAVNELNEAIVVGRTQSTDFPVVDAVQSEFGGSQDGFVVKLADTGNLYAYATYLGGASGDEINAIAISPAVSHSREATAIMMATGRGTNRLRRYT